MRAGEKRIRDLLYDKGCHKAFETQRSNGQTLTFYATPSGILILQSFGENGFDIYRPFTRSNNVDEDVAALEEWLGGYQ